MRYVLACALFLGLISIRAVFAEPFTPVGAEYCTSNGERVDGLNKICFYKCPSGDAAITIKSYQVCPVSLRR